MRLVLGGGDGGGDERSTLHRLQRRGAARALPSVPTILLRRWARVPGRRRRGRHARGHHQGYGVRRHAQPQQGFLSAVRVPAVRAPVPSRRRGPARVPRARRRRRLPREHVQTLGPEGIPQV